MWIHNYQTDIFIFLFIYFLFLLLLLFFFMNHHTIADVSNSLLATNSENVNLSLPLVTLLSQLIMLFKGLLCQLK